MELIGSGRDSDVFEYGAGLVLRRYRDGRPAGAEADVIREVGRLGYPAPTVHSTEGPDIVMQRVDGPSLAQAMQSGAVLVADGARMLAGLHDRLHALPWRGAEPLLHLDLHPLNVIVSSAGPVVIDWTNASSGPPGLDVAMSALILAQVVLTPGLIGERAAETFPRSALTEFLETFAGAVSTPYAADLPAAETMRRLDPNQSDPELALLTEAVALARWAAG